MRLQNIYCLTAMAALCAEAFGQATRPGATRPAAPAGQTEYVKRADIKIEKDRTPDYTVDATEGRSTTREWGKITVAFETVPEWLDEVKIRFYAATQDKNNSYAMFSLEVTYVDVPKGRHKATAFLAPSSVARYGVIERAAAELVITDRALRLMEQTAGTANTLGEQAWWRATSVPMVGGRLLSRDKTPFAFVAYDNYNSVKQP